MVTVEPPVARRPPSIPAALEEWALDGEPLADRLLEDVRVVGASLAGGDAPELRIERARLEDVTLDGVSGRGLALRDTTVSGGSWANADLQRSVLRAVELRGVR